MSDDLEISVKQEIVLLALLSGETQRSAAAAAGVREETVSRWLDDDSSFYRVYAARRAAVWQAYEARIAGMVDAALGAVESLMRGVEYHGSDDYSPSTRLEAAKVVLRMAGLLQSGPRVTAFGGGQVNIADRQINVQGE